jgi:hypothetical protein
MGHEGPEGTAIQLNRDDLNLQTTRLHIGEPEFNLQIAGYLTGILVVEAFETVRSYVPQGVQQVGI